MDYSYQEYLYKEKDKRISWPPSCVRTMLRLIKEVNGGHLHYLLQLSHVERKKRWREIHEGWNLVHEALLKDTPSDWNCDYGQMKAKYKRMMEDKAKRAKGHFKKYRRYGHGDDSELFEDEETPFIETYEEGPEDEPDEDYFKEQRVAVPPPGSQADLDDSSIESTIKKEIPDESVEMTVDVDPNHSLASLIPTPPRGTLPPSFSAPPSGGGASISTRGRTLIPVCGRCGTTSTPYPDGTCPVCPCTPPRHGRLEPASEARRLLDYTPAGYPERPSSAPLVPTNGTADSDFPLHDHPSRPQADGDRPTHISSRAPCNCTSSNQKTESSLLAKRRLEMLEEEHGKKMRHADEMHQLRIQQEKELHSLKLKLLRKGCVEG